MKKKVEITEYVRFVKRQPLYARYETGYRCNAIHHLCRKMKMKKIEGKTVVIPGASRPIGRHIARIFGEAGANIVLPWYDWPESVTEMVEEFTTKGYPFLECRCDLRDTDEVLALTRKTEETFGTVDYLINNIERGGMPVVHGGYDLVHNREQWDLEIQTSLKAKWNLYHHFKGLLRTSASGAVVNISSIAGLTGRSGPAACFFNDAYSAANRAIQTFTETWAVESSPKIRVNELMIGLINSRHGEKTRGWGALSVAEKDDVCRRPLLKRLGTEEEVARMVWFLAVEATYMTGAVVRMDGGYLLGGDPVPAMPPGVL